MIPKEKNPIQQKISENKEKFALEKSKFNREATLQKNREVLSMQNLSEEKNEDLHEDSPQKDIHFTLDDPILKKFSDYQEFLFKNFSYGSQNFMEFTSDDMFYIDRTNFIPLLEDEGKVLMFLRPKRFGKSLTLSMLEHYYDIKYKDQFQKIFGAFYIGHHPTAERNQYLTMKLSFSSLNTSGDLAHFEESLAEEIRNACIKFIRKYSDLLDIDKNSEIAKVEIKKDPISYFKYLTDLITVHKIYQGKFYLFIDEYDTAMNLLLYETNKKLCKELMADKTIQTANSMQNNFRRFFNTLKDQLYFNLGRIYITGVSSIAISSFVSSFVAENISYNLNFVTMCGFTATEISHFLTRFNNQEKTNNLLEIMKKYYNGYRFNAKQQETLYNPTLVTYFLKKVCRQGQIPESLLDPNLGVSTALLEVFSQPTLTTKILTELLTKNYIEIKQLKENFDIKDVSEMSSDEDSIASFMFQHGALTHYKKTEEGKNLFIIPNLEMKNEFIDRLKKILEINENFFPKLQSAISELENLNIYPLGNLIKEYYLSKLCQGDSKHSLEQDVKSAFLLIFNISQDYLDLEIENEFDISTKKGNFELWKQADLLLNKKFHFELKNILMSDLKYDDVSLKKECGKNEFQYLTKLSLQLNEQEDEEEIMKLELHEKSYHRRNGSAKNVQNVWENLKCQTKTNHAKIREKLPENGIKSFAIMRVGLYRLKMEFIQQTGN